MRDRLAWLAVAAALVTAAISAAAPVAIGQTVAPGVQTREQLNPAAQTEPAARRRARDIFSAPAPEACTLPDDPQFSFTLTGLDVANGAGLSSEAIRDAWADLDGAKITPRTICEIRDRVALRLFREGILARVVIPAPKICAWTGQAAGDRGQDRLGALPWRYRSDPGQGRGLPEPPARPGSVPKPRRHTICCWRTTFLACWSAPSWCTRRPPTRPGRWTRARSTSR